MSYHLKALYDLLCLIHRDNGQYLSEHGYEKAYADAVKVLNSRKPLSDGNETPKAQQEQSGWIPVTERLPKPQQFVLIAYTHMLGKGLVTMGGYVPAKTVESNFECDVDDEYDESTGIYYLKEQWVDESAESVGHRKISNVTHWMPLPEFPK